MGLFTSKKTATGPPAGPATVDPLDPDGGLPVFESHSGGLWVNGTRLKLKGEIGARVPTWPIHSLSLRRAWAARAPTRARPQRSYQSAPPALLTKRAPSAPTRARPQRSHQSAPPLTRTTRALTRSSIAPISLRPLSLRLPQASTGLAWRRPTASCTASGAARSTRSWTSWRTTASTPCACPSPSSWWKSWTRSNPPTSAAATRPSRA